MELIVGLGNPDRGYQHNRHNVGFMCLNYFAKAHGIKLDHKRANARVGTGTVASKEVTLARPQTYMNRSGQAVGKLIEALRIGLEDLIVVHDDLDLPVGKIRIRRGSSAGGHKGVESIIAALGSQEFTRIRVGIGRPFAEDSRREAEVIDYVLGDFAPEEKKTIDSVIDRVSEAIECLLAEGLAAAMNKYN